MTGQPPTPATVGSGADFRADLALLQRAALTELPDLAEGFARAAGALGRGRADLSALAGPLGHPVVDTLLALHDDLEDAAATSARHAHRAAEAVLQVAERYARTDDAAMRRFTRLNARLPLGPPPLGSPVVDPAQAPQLVAGR